MKIKLNSYKLLFRLLDLLSNSKWLHKLVVNRKVYLGASIISLSMLGNSCSSDKVEPKKAEDKKDSTVDNLNGNDIPQSKKDSIHRKTIKSKNANQEILLTVDCYDGTVEAPLDIPIEEDEIKKLSTKPFNIQGDSLEKRKPCYTIIEPMCYAVINPLPEFGAGDSLFKEYLYSNIVRPKGTEHISGTVILEFVIDKNGNIVDLFVRKSLHPQLDKEAIRVLNNMPDIFWPHKKRNYETTKYSLPIKFTAE